MGEAFDPDGVRPTSLIDINREISRKHIEKYLKFLDSKMPAIETGCLYAVRLKVPANLEY
jgi:hypothetical protein